LENNFSDVAPLDIDIFIHVTEIKKIQYPAVSLAMME